MIRISLICMMSMMQFESNNGMKLMDSCDSKHSNGFYCDHEQIIQCSCDRRSMNTDCKKKDEYSCKGNSFGCKKQYYGGFLSNFNEESSKLIPTVCRCNNGLDQSLSTRSPLCGLVIDNYAVDKNVYLTGSNRFNYARNSYDLFARELWHALKSNISISEATELSDRLLGFACIFTYPQCSACENMAHSNFIISKEYYVCFDPRPCWKEWS